MRVGTRSTRPVRSTLGLAAALAMVMALLPGTAFAQTAAPDARGTDAVCDGEYDSNFDDIAGSAHEGNIRCMADFELTEGLRGGTSYGPRLDVNRGQMASFIARFIEDYTDEDLPAGDANRFNDIDSTYVHASNINALAEIGVVEGTNASGGQSYAPNLGVTRAQMASFIRRALSYLDNGQVNPPSAPPIATADYFADDTGSVHEANINSIAGVGIVQGFQDGTYRPNEIVKRDQMASFIMRAYDYAVTEDLGADPTDPQPSVTITAEDGTVAPGDDVTVTFEGDVDQIDTVTVSGDCLAADDTPVTIGEDDTASITIDEDAADGDCVLTFTVTYDDEDSTVQTVDVTVTVQAPAPASVTVSTDAESVAPGDDLTVTFAGDVDQVDTVTVSGDCLAADDTPVTIGEDDTASISIDDEAADGDCVLTFTVTFDDDSTQTVNLTVPVATPAPEVGTISGTVTETAETVDPVDVPFDAVAEDGYLQIGDDLFDLPECPEGEPAEEGDECIEFAGVFNEDGTVTLGPDDISFPQLETEADLSGTILPVFVDISAPQGAEGTYDAGTGELALDTVLRIDINIGGAIDCVIEEVDLALGTDGEGSPMDGVRATLFDDTFAVPASTGGALCAAVNGQLGLPSPSGENEVAFDLLFDAVPETVIPGDPIEGATVSVDGTELSATTDADGNYVIEDAPAGTWDVTASAEGYESETVEDVVVTDGEDTTVDFELEPAEAEETFAPTVEVSDEEVCVGDEVTITLDNTGSTETAHYTGELTTPEGGTMPLNYFVDGGETHTITDTLGSEGTYRVEWLATADGQDDVAGQFEIDAVDCSATFAPTVEVSDEEVCVGDEVTITLDNTGSTETAHYTGELTTPEGGTMPLNYFVDGGETHTITDTLGSEGTYRVEWLATADGQDDVAGQFEIDAVDCTVD